MTRSSLDSVELEALVAKGAAGDRRARRELIERLWPKWVESLRASRGMGSLARSEDHVRNVATELMAKIERRDGHALRLYSLWAERHPDKTFLDWMRITTTNVVRNYVVKQFGPRRASSDAPGPKRLLNEFASSELLEELGIRPKITAVQTARELLEFAESHLSPEQLAVLKAWLEGDVFEDIAQTLGIDPQRVRQLQRAAVAQLRRRFSSAENEGK